MWAAVWGLLLLINGARGVPVTYDAGLAAAASHRAGQVAVCFEHPDGWWRTVYAEDGYRGGHYGEILAVAPFGCGQQCVFNSWMMSASHRAVIENPRYTRVGIVQRGWWWVVEFADG